MKTSDKGIAFLVAHEGVVPAPYWDSANPPVLTFGIGHTKAAGDPDPTKLPRGMPADLDAALREVFTVFRRDLAKYEADVDRALGSDGVFGLRPTSCPGRYEVLRFELMVERGLCEAATSIREGSAA